LGTAFLLAEKGIAAIHPNGAQRATKRACTRGCPRGPEGPAAAALTAPLLLNLPTSGASTHPEDRCRVIAHHNDRMIPSPFSWLAQ